MVSRVSYVCGSEHLFHNAEADMKKTVFSSAPNSIPYDGNVAESFLRPGYSSVAKDGRIQNFHFSNWHF